MTASWFVPEKGSYSITLRTGFLSDAYWVTAVNQNRFGPIYGRRSLAVALRSFEVESSSEELSEAFRLAIQPANPGREYLYASSGLKAEYSSLSGGLSCSQENEIVILRHAIALEVNRGEVI